MNGNLLKVRDNYNHHSMIVKSAVKISRNLEEYPFVVAMTEDISKEIFKEVYYKISDVGFLGNMSVLSSNKAEEKREISLILNRFFEGYSGLGEKGILKVLLSNSQNNIVIGINMKDHVEILVSGYGNKLEECYQVGYKIEENISSKVKLAFDEKLGFLSSAITELGTGLKISMCVHLPALTIVGYVDKLRVAIDQIGFSLEKAFSVDVSEGCHYYLISNKKTLGCTEEDLYSNIINIYEELIRKEIDARDTLLGSKAVIMEDRMHRAYGLLKYSKLLSYDEAIDGLSMIKLGKSFGLFDEVDENLADEKLFGMSDYKSMDKKLFSQHEIDQWRSDFIKGIFI